VKAFSKRYMLVNGKEKAKVKLPFEKLVILIALFIK